MPTAIQLTRKNIDVISETLGIKKKHVSAEWTAKVMETPEPEPVYYVKDVLYFETVLPYLIYTEREFLDDFASIPDGIQDRFVPVTQIKVEP